MSSRARTVGRGASSRPDPALPEVIGRDAELAAVDAFIDGCRVGSCALAIEGPPGIGKTTVWRWVAERAAVAGLDLLACRVVEVEATMAYVALADLCEPVVDEVLPLLPGVQRVALEVALLRAETAREVEPRAVGSAVRSLLAALSERAPLVIVIDDLQWVDRASAAALAFALRRLEDRPVSIAVTSRTQEVVDPLALEQAFGQRLRRLRLGPLGRQQLQRVVQLHLGRTLPRPVLERLHAASEGNPLLALEVARAFPGAGGRPAPAASLPVPDTVMQLVGRRLAAQPARTREALLVAACAAAPTQELVRRALGREAAAVLGPAVQAGLIELRGERLVFPHPLFASAVTETAEPAERRRLHRRLAELVSDPDEQARHLALAASGPDPDAAAMLDAAADRARLRGAPGVAADLLQWAAELTPPAEPDAGHRRIIAAAGHAFRAGDLLHARSLLEGIAERVQTRGHREAVLRLLGQIRYGDDSFDAAIPLLSQALALCDVPDREVEILLDLAFAHFSVGDLPRALDAARSAVRRGEQAGSGPVLAEALAVEANVRFFAGAGADLPQLDRSLALEDPERSVQVLIRPTAIAALFSIYLGRLADGVAGLRALKARALERGEEVDCRLLTWLARAEIWQGELDAAERTAHETLSLAAQTSSDACRAAGLLGLGHVWAVRGDHERAREHLDASRSLLADVGWNAVGEWTRWTLGFLDLSAGRHGAAVEAFTGALTAVEAAGVAEPFAVEFVPDAVEALVAEGQLERAERLLDEFEGRARALGRTVALVGATRCRALLLARLGRVAEAREAVEESLHHSQHSELPVERGRSVLVHGQLLRRSRQKQAARAALEQAWATFEQVGARLWLERAREELDRVGGSTPRGDLTPTEQRVAELAGAGRTNKEIAGALFISPKTVEANLSRVYRKLGLRSRAELSRLMGERSMRR